MAYLSAFKSPDVTFAFSFPWIRFITRFYENRPISSACSSPAFCAGEFAKHLLLHYGLLVNNNHLIVKRGANFVDATWQWCNDIYSLSATPSRWNNVLLGKRKELYDHGVGIFLYCSSCAFYYVRWRQERKEVVSSGPVNVFSKAVINNLPAAVGRWIDWWVTRGLTVRTTL